MSQLSQILPQPSQSVTAGVASLWALVAMAGGILILAIFTTLIFQVIYLNRVYPGVSVMGIGAGGMTQAELITAINEQAPIYLNRSITIECRRAILALYRSRIGHADQR